MYRHKAGLFEHTPLPEAFRRLVLPTALGQLMLVVYNVADTFYIGLTNSNINTTSVTICMPVFMILTSISNLFGIGASSTISRALGKMSYQRARDTSAFAFWLCLVTCIAYSAAVLITLDRIVNFIGGSHPEVHAKASEYILITVVIGGLFTSLGFLASHIIRTEGNAAVASVGVIGSGLLNVILDPLFMFVILPDGQEVRGAAIATGLSNFIGFAYFALYFLKKRKNSEVLSIHLSKSCFRNKIPSSVFGAGLPAATMTLCENVSYAFLDNLMAAYGTAALAGIGVAKKVNMLSHSAVRGISQGALPLIGYNYSAGRRKDTNKAVILTATTTLTVSLTCVAINFLFARQLVDIFINEGTKATEYGAKFLMILSIGAPFSAIAYTFISFFQAVGHGVRSLILALLRKGILDIPLMFLMGSLWPMYGLVQATPSADIICCAAAVICFIVFRKAHLKHNKARKIYNEETGKVEIWDAGKDQGCEGEAEKSDKL